MARLLILRPAEEADASAASLAALGHQPLVAPILACVRTGLPIDPDGADAVIATSARAIRCLTGREGLQNLPLFAVGATTASVAREAGFVHVVEGGGQAKALVETILASLRPAARLVYLAGEPRRPTVESNLAAAGVEVKTFVVYRMRQASELPSQAVQSLVRQELDAVLHYSAETAAHFVRLVEGAGLVAEAARPLHLCLSAAVGREISVMPSSKVVIAGQPDEAALFSLIPGTGH